MAGVNQFLVFGTNAGSNTMSFPDYQALSQRASGFNSGLAPSIQVNTALRQGAFMSAVMGQFIANVTNDDVLDDGDQTGKVALFVTAIQQTAAAGSAAGLAAETQARIAADSSEAAARQLADGTETTARIAADSAEASARSSADTALNSSLSGLISSEATTRANADAAETNARIAADSAEATARGTADAARVTLAGGAVGGAMTGPLFNTVSIICGNQTTNYNPTLSSIFGAGLGGGGVNCYNDNGGVAAALFGIQTPGPLISLSYHGNNIGAITTDGATITVQGTSDRRLKEKLVPITYEYALGQMKLAQVYMGNFIATPEKRMLMIVADEFSKVSPESVMGEPDAMKKHLNLVMQPNGKIYADNVEEDFFKKHQKDYPDGCYWQAELEVIDPQQVDLTKSFPLMIVTIQALMDQVEKLTARVATLEAK